MALVNTIHGEIDDSLLERRDVREVQPNGVANAIEYWYNGELVHRSVHFVFNQDAVPVFEQVKD